MKVVKNEAQIKAVETLAQDLLKAVHAFEKAAASASNARAKAEPGLEADLASDLQTECHFYRSRVGTLVARFQGWCDDDRNAIAPKKGSKPGAKPEPAKTA